MTLHKSHSDTIFQPAAINLNQFLNMRTTQELIEYVDRIVHIGVDKTEMRSQFAFIDLEPASGNQDEICEAMLVPLVVNPDELEGLDGDGI
jgi:hypothetical protein